MSSTGSGLGRDFECPANQALPHVHEQRESAAIGTIRHEFMQRVPVVGVPSALEEAPEGEREYLVTIDMQGLPLDPSAYEQEIAYCYNWKTGKAKRIGHIKHRAYPKAEDGDIFCTLDVVGMGEVYDWKFHGGFESHTEPIATNKQMLFGALCVARTALADSIDIALIHFGPDGKHRKESRTLDSFDLDAFEADLRRAMQRVEDAKAQVARGEVPSVVRGEHCRWCPAAAACPAVTSLVRAAANEPVKTAADILAMLTPETAPLAYRRLVEVDDALKAVRSALYMYATDHPIDLGNGKVYGPVSVSKDEIDGTVARKVLAKLHSPEVADAACDFSTSKAAIERALKPVAKSSGLTIKSVKEEALAAIQAAGGISTKHTQQVKEHKEKEAA